MSTNSGTLTCSKPELSPEELGKLFAEFSRATDQLQGAHDALLAEVQVLRDELARKNQQLERKKRLEALGRVAAGVAHEFRNPLGGMRLTIDALLAEPARDERSRVRLRHVQNAITHLDRIVEDLLTFARSKPLEKRRVRIADLVEHALSLAFADSDAAAPRVLRGGAPQAEALVDRQAFTQVLLNLFLNARQAMGAGVGRLGVWWGSSENGRLWIEVADEGPGIAPGEEDLIFELFHSRREGGTGLGLAIVHDRVVAHEGEIAVVRDARGGGADWKGARFRIVVPAGI